MFDKYIESENLNLVEEKFLQLCLKTFDLILQNETFKSFAEVESMNEKPSIFFDDFTIVDFWNMPHDALGFQAVCSPKYDEDNDEDYLEIADKNMAVINIKGNVSSIKDIYDICEPEISILSALVTIPHEMIHVLQWIKETKGKTPIEMFDSSSKGELVFDDIFNNIEKKEKSFTLPSSENRKFANSEDFAENTGRKIIDQIEDKICSSSEYLSFVESFNLSLKTKVKLR